MSGKVGALRDRWLVTSVATTAVVAIVAIVVGFIWLPAQEPNAPVSGLWGRICSAAGFFRQPSSSEAVVAANYPTTRVEVTPQLLGAASAGSIGHGATLALGCTMCHGAQGVSDANTPNLAGQYPIAIYKQLDDFKTGARTSAIMGPLVNNLDDQDMRDLAAYYAYLPQPTNQTPAGGGTPRIVADGAPLRGIAPCGACHGVIGTKAGASWLGDQPAAYLHTQLTAFAQGSRRNDIDAQMRNVARAMTPTEINAATAFFATHP